MARPTKTFLPQIHGNSALSGQSLPCGMNDRAYAFAEAWLERLGERGKRMVCNGKLVQCAQDHAHFLAGRVDTEPSMHIGRNGSTANQRVRNAGYRLPLWHGNGNTVESCARSWDAIPEAAADLMAHDSHRDHMHGIGFFEPSTVYGVGNVGEYFVVIAAPPEE